MNRTHRPLVLATWLVLIGACSSVHSTTPTSEDSLASSGGTSGGGQGGQSESMDDGGPIVLDAMAGGTTGETAPNTEGTAVDSGVPISVAICVPATCASLGRTCGEVSDNCGHIVQCGTCAKDQICSSTSNTCVAQSAVCGGDKGCGMIADACGNGFACSKTCGFGTKCEDNQCTACQPIACDGRCGNIPDGCGGVQACGACATGQVCDAIAFTCSVCQKLTCAGYPPTTCGTLSNGCGGVISCPCASLGTTVPRECVEASAECGKVGDHCSATVTHDCGACTGGKVCNGNKCVTCTPKTCASAGKNCGTLDDGCGNKLTCGTCQTNQI